MKVSLIELMEIAGHLYDGGWRASDRAQLKEYYDLTDEATEKIVACLKMMEE